ncbi:flagellar FlbD family protein [Enterococcus cecorum]|uniref:flagellar FlbD family protein n=1 Tax=Enterococcus cecorum TaxID=44008 RepID=UPI00200B03EA|nr:flagellar FlbD family protein [Enterococcus cecorum]
MKMIKLDALAGEMYFNVDKIEALAFEGELTVVALTNGNNDNYFRVRETPEEIIELIKQAEEI